MVVGFIGQGKKKSFSSNLKCYNLSVHAAKAFEIFSTHFHTSLIQICMFEF